MSCIKKYGTQKVLFLVIMMVVCFGGVAYAINILTEGYRVLPTIATKIDTTPIGGDCKIVVTPNDGKDRFVPTGTLSEWNYFKSAAPGLGISLNPCLTPPKLSLAYVGMPFNTYGVIYENSNLYEPPSFSHKHHLTPGETCLLNLGYWIRPYPWNYDEWWQTITGPVRVFGLLPGHVNASGQCIMDAIITMGPYGAQPNAPIDIQPRTCYLVDGQKTTSERKFTFTGEPVLGHLVFGLVMYGTADTYYDCVAGP